MKKSAGFKQSAEQMTRSLGRLILLVVISSAFFGCSTAKSILAVGKSEGPTGPIHNPFGEFYANSKNDPNQNMILRTKKGDRSVEIELPRTSQGMTDFSIPVSPAFSESSGDRNPASVNGDPLMDESYKTAPPTMADREITRSFPQGMAEDDGKRRDIEQGLGLMPSEDSIPESTGSYLAALDHVKLLYKAARYEAALMEIDRLIHQYPTDPKIYQMRGSLLDRVGQTDLAIKSWSQALRFDPKNTSLRKFVDRRQHKRSIASP